MADSRATGGAGQPLPLDERRFFEERFGHEFSQVRVHTDRSAAAAAAALDADAFTLRNDIAFGEGRYQPGSAAGRHLLAHELAHVVQHGAASPLPGGGAGRAPAAAAAPPKIHRRLLATGSAADFASFQSLAEPALGAHLTRDPTTNRVSIGAALPKPATSPAFASTLRKIINHATQNAEVNFGTHQAQVGVGAFPAAGHSVQRIDMDDVRAIEAGAPGNGVGKLAHEINENFVGHAGAAPGTVGAFGPAHRQGVKAESDVARQLAGPGTRVAEVDRIVSPNVTRRIQDFTNYYLVFDLTRAGTDFTVSNARRASRAAVSTVTIDSFNSGSAAIPGAGAPTIAAAAATIAAHPGATVLIEGFADNVGSAASNLTSSQHRANSARSALVTAGIDGGRIHTAARGASHFVAPNTTPAGRAQNRRVVITVTEPGP